jgi:transcriptional regulator with XRE-family HTH domain
LQQPANTIFTFSQQVKRILWLLNKQTDKQVSDTLKRKNQMKLKNWKTWALTGAFALVTIGGTAGFVAAQEGGSDVAQRLTAVAQGEMGHRGGGERGAKGEALAAELGITVEELQAAHEAAKEAMIEQATADGWVSEDDAETGRPHFGRGPYYEGIYDKGEFLADALGISVSELEAAKAAVFKAHLAEKVDAGDLTEAEAADITAVHTFKESIDKDAMLAEALGISVSELDAARDNTTSFHDLLDELGLTHDELRDNMQAIAEQTVQDAVDSGELTEAQAELLQNSGRRGGHGGPRGGEHGPRGGEHGPRDGGQGPRGQQAPTGDNA